MIKELIFLKIKQKKSLFLIWQAKAWTIGSIHALMFGFKTICFTIRLQEEKMEDEE